MINLIPKEEKKKKNKSFYNRLTVVYLLILDITILFGLVVMIPSYFLTYVKVDLANKKLEIQKNEPVPIPEKQTLVMIENLNKKLDIIDQALNNKFTISKNVINAILTRKISNIKITDISYENNPINGKKVSIRGTAPSREVLLLFRLALEEDVIFKQVDLPISNFVKGSDIQFYLSLIPQ